MYLQRRSGPGQKQGRTEMNRSDEYAALRQEILEGQKRRVSVTMNTATVVGAVLGLGTSLGPRSVPWAGLSAILVTMLSGAMLFAYYSAEANARMGAYIQAFHESGEGWETLRAQLPPPYLLGLKLDLNVVLAVMYVSLAAVAVAVPWMAANFRAGPTFGLVVLAFAIILFGIALRCLFVKSYSRRKEYLECFRRFRTGEA